MIPHIIHFCWFGGNPLPPLAIKCIQSWRRFFPNYEIWEWREDESNYSEGEGDRLIDRVMTFDVNDIAYTLDAYKLQKYAFVSDYARFWILQQYGGIYFDTDVEVIRPLDDIVENGSFMGFETNPDGDNSPGKYAPGYCFGVNPGLGFAMEKGHPFLDIIIEEYKGLNFRNPSPSPWRKTVVAYTTEALCKYGLENKTGVQNVMGITIYPQEYFAPINVITSRLRITSNTRSVHRYMGSWTDSKQQSHGIKSKIRGWLPDGILMAVNRLKRRKYRIK